MIRIIEPYITPILNACLLFPFVAAMFTLPYLVAQYRKYGGIAAMRTIVVYSFILYSLCAFFLTVLPLPTRAEVAAMPTLPIQWVPFTDPYLALKNAGFVFSQPATWFSLANWKTFLTSRGLFQIVANIVMQIPLGFYLRYYFRRTWKQTLLIGLGVSLFYELTQLSGLYFIYPKAYRLCETDDLINNTLGAMIGYWIAPLLGKILPSREELDRISYEKGRRVTTMRRLVAAAIDWGVQSFLLMGLMSVPGMQDGVFGAVFVALFGYVGWVVLYFVLLQRLWNGRTIGKALLRVRVVSSQNAGGGTAKLWQLFVRYATIYYLSLPIMLMGALVLMVLGVSTVSASPEGRLWLIGIMVTGAGLALLFILRFYRKWNKLPHGKWSRTEIIQEARPPRPRPRGRGEAKRAKRGAAQEVSDGAAGVALPDAACGTPDAASGTTDTACRTPDAASGTPDAASGTPDAASGTVDAASGTPDAASGTLDTVSGTPDAPPPNVPASSHKPPTASSPR